MIEYDPAHVVEKNEGSKNHTIRMIAKNINVSAR